MSCLYKGCLLGLFGVRVDNLVDKREQQLSIFDNHENKKQDNLDSTIDKLKEKYGYGLITRAGQMNVDDIVNIRKRD